MPKTLKAEIWDKMQYLFRDFYDRMVHCVQIYDAPIDVAALKNVLIWTTEKTPILHSSFRANAVEPYWQVEEYTIDDILKVQLDCEDLDEVVDRFICQSIPVDNNVQYKVAVFSDGNRWALAMIVNHMCMDGGDFKYFMKKLAENYNKQIAGERGFSIKTGSRALDEVYSNLTEEEQEIAKGLYKNISAVKDEHYFPLTPSSKDDHTMICKRKVEKELFDNFKAIGKKLDVTVNDLMLAFYIRALYDIGMFNDSERLSIPCMVDLRRHIEAGGANTGLTNHTGFMVCSVENKGETINDTLINVLRSVRKSKDDPYMGLYSLPLLKLAYAVFPQVISETAIKIGYMNPLIGMSNIGLLNDALLKLGDANLIDGFMTGAVKFKPYMQLALTTVKGVITMTIAIRGNDEDKKIVEKFFDLIVKNMQDFVELNRDKL
ncbi:MAG: hypothetical protein II867_00745 [Clostridia bacterium]|nr:hypothetical protein [Clostridia bacterium]